MNLSINNKEQSLSIRLLQLEDSIAVYRLIDQSRSELKNLLWSINATLDSTTEFIKFKNNSLDRIYGVFYDTNLVGVLELRKKEDMFELGYWVGSKYRGKGLMKNAVKALVDNQIKSASITAHIREHNHASHKILQYAGLKFDHIELWQGENWLHLKREKE
jgi:ribosomal-protein-serine acetyltransferase